MKKYLLYLLTAIPTFGQVPIPNVLPKTNVNYQLAWDASTTSGVTYVVRRGTASGKYDEMVATGALSYTWSNAPAKMTNYFVVSAKNASSVESDYSNELRIEPLSRPEAPNLRTAVPITVKIQERNKDGEWVDSMQVGPFYRVTLDNSNFRSTMVIGQPVNLLP